jgi:hypothetical protein
MCTIIKHLEIRPATRAAYDELAQFHYRGACPAVYTAIYAMYDMRHSHVAQPSSAVGIIVYTMPAMELAVRNSVLVDLFKDCRNRKHRLQIINQNIRCISRVIIEPRYRGLGLAAQLVRQTMPLQNVPIIEAVAAMGRINPFFEKAGMHPYPVLIPRHVNRMLKALKTVGIDERLFIHPTKVQRKMDALCGQLKFWLEHEIQKFLQAYGNRRHMPPSQARTRFVLSKLSSQPVYYLWCKGDPCGRPIPVV